MFIIAYTRLTMTIRKNILAICGSTRASSSNLNLIKAIESLYHKDFKVHIYEGLSELPHFNPDLDLTPEDAPESVAGFRGLLKNADAVLICTPEYAIGVPGSLKNAVDWTVSSMDFSQKPVFLITASTSGLKSHQSLLGTLLIIESKITEPTQFVVSSIKTKVNSAFEITDDHTLDQIKKGMENLKEIIDDKEHLLPYLPAPSMH